MKDSKTIRNEHQTFVDAWKKIQEDNSSAPVEEGYGKSKKKMLKTNKGYKESKVLVRKSGAFTALAEKYNMSPKQFGRYVEANQHLFDIPTRKKAILANKFQGFKETKEWDEFFGDLELVEGEVIDETITLTKGDYASRNSPGSAYAVAKRKGFDKKIYKAGGGLGSNFLPLVNSHEPEGENLQEITTKDTKSGTKFKVRVKDKKTNSSYIRFATRDKIAQLRSDPKIASVEMTDEGQTPEERGEKKAQAAGGGSPKKAKKDYDGDGKVETGSQEYLGSRDKAIKKAMKKRSVTTEAQSNWREDLKEIMGEVEKTEGKKSKSKKKNGICINPDTDDEKNKYEEVNAQKVAESLGAELQSLKIEDADGNVAYEVIDLVKPDPIKENKVMLTYNSARDKKIDLNIGKFKNVRANIDKGKEIVSNIKNEKGIVKGIKKTLNNNTTSKTSVSDNISSAIKDYKSST